MGGRQKYEVCKQLGIDAIGIEKEAEYVKIGKLRLKAWKAHTHAQ